MPTPVKLPARVTDIQGHSDSLRSFTLSPERRPPPFRAGQFLHLALDCWDPSAHWPESRVFSIASSPLEREQLRITVSRQGAFTTRMFQELAVGSTVWLKLPYGDFCPGATLRGPAVLMAGGSGVTPFISFLLWASVREPKALVYLHYGARTPRLLIYRDVISSCSERMSNLTAHYYSETGEPAEGLHIARLSVERAWKALRDPLSSRFYLSGPKAMIDAFRQDLLARGTQPDNVLSDDWG